MASNLRLAIELTADGKVAVREVRSVGAEVGKLGSQSKSATTDLGGLDRSVGNLAGSLRALLPALSVTALAAFSRSIVTASDEVDLLSLQAENLGGDFDKLFASAQRLGVGLDDVGRSMNLLTPAFEKVGKGYEQALEFNEKLTKSLYLYGVSGAEAAAVTLQLAQGLSNDSLQGQDLKSLSSYAGGLVDELEKVIQKTTGSSESIKELGSQGALSAKVIINAFEEVFSKLEDGFEKLPNSLEQQESRFANSATRLFDAMDDSLHASDFWKFLTEGATNLLDKATEALTGVPVRDAFGGAQEYAAALADEIVRVTEEIENYKKQQQDLVTTPFLQGLGIGKLLDEPIAQAEQRLAALAKALEAVKTESKPAAVSIESVSADIETISRVTGVSVGKVNEHIAAIKKYAAVADIPENIAIALVKVESAFDEVAKSPTGPYGLAQITKAAVADVKGPLEALGFTIEDAFTIPEANVAAGLLYLDQLRDRFGSLSAAIAAYNAGPGAFSSVAGDLSKLSQETQNYVPAVENLAAKLALAAGESKEYQSITKDLSKYQNEAAKAAQEHDEKIRDVLESTQAGARETREYIDAQRLLESAVASGVITQEEANTALEVYRDRMIKAAEAGGDLGVKVKEAAKEVDLFADILTEAANNAVRSIQGTLADAFEDLFKGTLDSAEDFSSKLGDVIISAVANIAAQIATQSIVVPIVASITGQQVVNGQVVSGTGTTSTSSTSLLDNVSNLFTGTNIGQSLSTATLSVSEFFDQDWSGAVNALKKVPNYAFEIGGLVGSLAGSWLFEGTEASIGASIGSAAGSYIAGALAFGPIGVAAAGILGGVGGGFIGSLFGGGEEAAPQVTLGKGGGQVQIVSASSVSSGDYEQLREGIDSVNAALEQIYSLLSDEAVDAARQTTQGTSPRYLQDVDEAIFYEVQGLLKAAAGTGDDLAQEFLDAWNANSGNIDAAFEEGFAALSDLAYKLASIPAIQDLISLTNSSENASALLEDQILNLIDAFGGADIAFGAISDYMNLFYSDAELYEIALSDMKDAFEALGLTFPETREEFRALVDSMGLTSVEGQNLYTALIALAPSMDALYNAADNLGVGAEEAVEQVEDLVEITADLYNALARTNVAGAWVVGTLYDMATAANEFGFSFDTLNGIVANIVDLLGGTDAAQSKLSAYIDEFFSDQEQYYLHLADLSYEFQQLNQTLPDTKEGFRDLVESVDVTTEAGQQLYAALIDLAPSFGDLIDEADALAETIDTVVASTADVEAFISSLRPDPSIEALWADFSSTFAAWGLTTVPTTREELVALYDAGVLTTEQMAELAEQADTLTTLFDGLSEQTAQLAAEAEAAQVRIQGLIDALQPDRSIEEQIADLQTVFDAWGLGTVPATRAEMLALVEAGALTNAQLDELAQHTSEIAGLYSDVEEAQRQAAVAMDDLLDSLRPDPTLQQLWEQWDATFREFGLSTVPATREALLALIDAGAFADDQVAYLAANRDSLNAYYDALLAEQEAAQQAAIDAQIEQLDRQEDAVRDHYSAMEDAANDAYNRQRDALQEQYDLRREAYNKQREAAQDWVSEIERILSILGSAISAFAPQLDDLVNLDFERARRQLDALVRSGATPNADQLDSITSALVAGKDSRQFTTAREEEAANALIRGQLQTLERRGEGRLSVAERQLDAAERAIEAITDQRDAMLDALSDERDRQLEQAEEWRDQELARLDALKDALDEQAQQPAISDEALAALTATFRDGGAGGEKQVVATEQQTAEIVQLRGDVSTTAQQQLDVLNRIDTWFRRWEEDGLPTIRDDENGSPVYLMRVG